VFSVSRTKTSSLATPNRSYHFSIKDSDSVGLIEIVRDPSQIDKKAARAVLVESFITEYEKYLSPSDISDDLTSWRDGDKSVRQYYENYFQTEFDEFSRRELDYWVQATIDGKLVGWATFQREKIDKSEIYMNLLIVHPGYQKRSIGQQLVMSLINLQEISNLRAIHLLIRKKNQGGRIFYSKLGFNSDPEYHRENYVDLSLLEGLTWINPDLQHKHTAACDEVGFKQLGNLLMFKPKVEQTKKNEDFYLGFKPGFLIGKRF